MTDYRTRITEMAMTAYLCGHKLEYIKVSPKTKVDFDREFTGSGTDEHIAVRTIKSEFGFDVGIIPDSKVMDGVIVPVVSTGEDDG